MLCLKGNMYWTAMVSYDIGNIAPPLSTSRTQGNEVHSGLCATRPSMHNAAATGQ